MYYKDGKAIKFEVLSRKQWDKRISNIFQRNIKQYGKSRDKSGIAHALHDCIIEIEYDTGDITIGVDEYKRLYKTAGICT